MGGGGGVMFGGQRADHSISGPARGSSGRGKLAKTLIWRHLALWL